MVQTHRAAIHDKNSRESYPTYNMIPFARSSHQLTWIAWAIAKLTWVLSKPHSHGRNTHCNSLLAAIPKFTTIIEWPTLLLKTHVRYVQFKPLYRIGRVWLHESKSDALIYTTPHRICCTFWCNSPVVSNNNRLRDRTILCQLHSVWSLWAADNQAESNLSWAVSQTCGVCARGKSIFKEAKTGLETLRYFSRSDRIFVTE